MLRQLTMVMVVGVAVARPDKDPIHMQHRVEVDQVFFFGYGCLVCDVQKSSYQYKGCEVSWLEKKSSKLFSGGGAGVKDLRHDGRPAEREEDEG